MSVDIETLGVAVDTSGLKDAQQEFKKTTKAGEETADAADKVGGRFKALDSAIGGVTKMLAGIGVTMVAKQLAQMADTVTLMDARLKLAIGSGADYAKAQEDIYAIAQKNNMGLAETAELYTKLHEPVKLLGGGVKETSAITEAFALTMKVGGANAQAAASATLQFAQAMGKGSLSGDEFNSIAEASPRLLKALAEGMGVPIGKLKEMGSEGKLTADVVGNALVGSLETLRSESEQIPLTIGAAFQSAANMALDLVGTFDKLTGTSGGVAQMISSALEPALRSLFSVAVGVYQAFQTLGTAIGGVFAAIGAALSGDFKGAKQILSEMSDDITAGWAKSGQAISDVWNKTGVAAGVAASEVKKLKGSLEASGAEKNKAAAAAKKLADEYDNLIAKIYGKDNGTDPDFIKNLKLIETQGLKVGKSMEVIRKEQEAYIKLQPYAIKEQEKLNKEYEDAVKGLDGMLDAQEKNVDTLKKQVEQERFAVESMGLNKEAVVELEIAKLNETAAQKERLAALADDIDLSGETGKAYREQARLLRELGDLKRQGAVKDTAMTKAKEAADEWTKMTDGINQTLTDALMRGFESGKGFAENLRDTVVNMFKTLVLRPVISGVLNVAMGAGAQMLGLGGGSSGGGGLSNMLGMASNAGSMLSLGSQWAAGAMSGANVAGSMFANMTGTGIDGLLAANGAYGTAAGGGGGFMAGAAQALPWVAGGLLVANALGLFRKTKKVGYGLTGTLGEGDIEGYDLMRKSGTLFSGPSYSIRNTGVAEQSGALQSAYSAMRTNVANMAELLGASSEAIRVRTMTLGSDVLHNDTGGIGLKLDGLSAEEAAAKVQEALQAANEELVKMIPGLEAFAKEGETAVQTLERLAAIQSVSETLNQFGGIFSVIAGSSIEARESLIGLAGGIDALVSQANQFVKDYYSLDEQAGINANAIAAALTNVGLSISDLAGKEDFRALVESLNPEDSTQREQLAALLQIAPNFAELSKYLQENNMTLEDAMKNAPDVPILQAILDPSQVTAQATQQMVSQLSGIEGQLGGIQQAADAAASAAGAAAAAAGSAAAAAGSAAGAAAAAASDAALTASQPGYSYDFGGA